MKKPNTFKELVKLVNPKDLYEILNFCGVNDFRDKEHSEIKRKFADLVYKSKGEFGWRALGYIYFDTPEAYYDSIVKCIQDFYRWSHKFSHIYAHIYQRVVNALEIPMDKIEEIMEEK